MSRELHIVIPIPPDSFYDKYTNAETLAYGLLSAFGEYDPLAFTATWGDGCDCGPGAASSLLDPGADVPRQDSNEL